MNAIKSLFMTLLVAVAFFSHAQNVKPSEVQLTWGVIENHHRGKFEFLSEFVLTNKSVFALQANWAIYFNFCRKVKPESLPKGFKITHINGDFFKLEPSAAYVPLKSGESAKIPFVSGDWAINYSDAPAGVYVAFNNDESTAALITNYSVLPFTTDKQLMRFDGDHLSVPTPQSIFAQNKRVNPSVSAQRIVPSPLAIYAGKGSFSLTSSTSLMIAEGLENEISIIQALAKQVLGKPLQVKTFENQSQINSLHVKIGDIEHNAKKYTKGSEAYMLNVLLDRIELVGADPEGVFYGIQTLKALMPVTAFQSPKSSLSIEATQVYDAPRFQHRGMHLDVSRNFQTKASVLKLLDLMSYYKLNKFHFHLTDDEGWRIEIPSLPELTQVGSKRGHTLTEKDKLVPSFGSGPSASASTSYGSGYYSKADFIEILKYATARHIEVIPEIDVPGHARAAVKAMDARYERLMKEGKTSEAAKYLLKDADDFSEYSSVQMWKDNVICICQQSTYDFLDLIVKEVVGMYKEAKAPITTWHIGGDEVPQGVWEKSANCQRLLADDKKLKGTEDLLPYFMERFGDIVKKYDLRVAGWEEIAFKIERKDGHNAHIPSADHVKDNYEAFVWNNVWGWGSEDVAYKLANMGYKIVMANATNLYFDLAYSKDPNEPGYYWAGFCDVDKPYEFVPFDIFKSAHEDRMGNHLSESNYKDRVMLTEEGKKNIVGIQGQLWSENNKGPEVMDYMMFPKLIGLAERAWSADPEWAQVADSAKRDEAYKEAWSAFCNGISMYEFPRLDYMSGGVNYRIPSPGATIENGTVVANVQYPTLVIRYTTDGSEPTVKSLIYKAPIKTVGTVKLKAFNSVGRSSRTSTIVVK